MRRWLLRLLVVALLAAVVLVLRATVFAPKPIAVEVALVERGAVEATVTNSRAGTVRARRRAKLSPELGGTVVALPFREGQPVRAGDVVLRLDDSLPRARLEVAQRQLTTAEAEGERACLAAERTARELERVRGLVASEIVSADRLDEVESAARTAQATCTAARAGEAQAAAGIELARAELGKTVLRAPFDGVVADLATELGEYSTPSPPAVPVPAAVDILDPASIYVSAPMDEVDSARIHPGQPVRLTVDSHRGIPFAAHVVRVAPYVLDREEQNRTVEIEVELDDPAAARELLPGTSADVEVILERRESAVRIPTPSLIEGRRVLVLEAGRLRGIEVEPGLANWEHTEIVSGLEPGMKIVSSLDRAEVREGAEAVEAGAGAAP